MKLLKWFARRITPTLILLDDPGGWWDHYRQSMIRIIYVCFHLAASTTCFAQITMAEQVERNRRDIATLKDVFTLDPSELMGVLTFGGGLVGAIIAVTAAIVLVRVEVVVARRMVTFQARVMSSVTDALVDHRSETKALVDLLRTKV
jgi:hypothetical protein